MVTRRRKATPESFPDGHHGPHVPVKMESTWRLLPPLKGQELGVTSTEDPELWGQPCRIDLQRDLDWKLQVSVD